MRFKNLTYNSKDKALLIKNIKEEIHTPFICFIGIGSYGPILNKDSESYYTLFNKLAVETISKVENGAGYERLEILFNEDVLANEHLVALIASFYYVLLFGINEAFEIEEIKKASNKFSIYSKMNPKRWKHLGKKFMFIDVEHGTWDIILM